MLDRVNALTYVLAFGLFFLPWIDIRCAEAQEPTYTQTGLQIATGTATDHAAEKLKGLVDDEHAAKVAQYSKFNRKRASMLVLTAMALTALGMMGAIGTLFGMRETKPGVLAVTGLIAAGCIFWAFHKDLPAQKAVDKHNKPNPSTGIASIEVKPAFYGTLGCLIMPTIAAACAAYAWSRED